MRPCQPASFLLTHHMESPTRSFHYNWCHTYPTPCETQRAYPNFLTTHMMSAWVEMTFGCLELQITTKKRNNSKKFFSRTQKYFTRQTSCDAEWEYGWLLAMHTMAGCFEMIAKCLNFQIQIFLRTGITFWREKYKCQRCSKATAVKSQDNAVWWNCTEHCMFFAEIP